MIKRALAVLLSFFITALSAGPQCGSVLAQQVSARGVSAVRLPAGAVSLSPAGLGVKVVGAINPLMMGTPTPILQARSARANAPKPGQPGEAKTPFQETLADLEAPSLVEKVSPEASGTEVRAAGRDDFALRLGEGTSSSQDGVAAAQEKSAGLPALAPATQDDAATLEELKQILGDGVMTEHGFTRPFGFKTASGQWVSARSAGLEGFLYTKLELERTSKTAPAGPVEDYFNYLDGLLAPMSWTQPLRKELAALRASKITDQEKNGRLTEKLVSAVSDLQGRVRALDGALWVRQANIYMIFARAYNRLRPGKNFLDSIDEEEFSRIKAVSGSNVIWLQDIFEIGKINRWGTGGGSSYAITGYRVKEALGGDEALKRLIQRAERAGFKICVDFIPNHGAIDGDLVKAHPDGAIHIVPPPEIQKLSNEEILAAVPRQKGTPVFYLVETDGYPENGRLVHKKVLIHHPLTDEGDMWIDMAQYDFSRPQTRAWGLAQSRRLLEKFGVKLFRLDMSNEVVNERYFPRWHDILTKERDRSQGWVREEMTRFIEGFERRRRALEGREFLTEMSAEDRRAAPDAGKISEAYTNFEALSRTGTNGIYNKVELYDALVSRDPARIRAAQKSAAFKEWQLGAAAAVNFVGTHDGGEGNPVDKFGREFKAAVLTALSSLPILFYNGLELGVGQKEMLEGDLSKSVDTSKAIPMDIPVSIKWEALNAENQQYLKMVLARTQRKVTNVMDPRQESPISAWSEAAAGTILIKATNFSQHRGSGVFDMKSPVLGPFGAFEPRADRDYVLRDFANPVNGQPAVYERSGRDLLDQGLYIELAAGGTHLFEVEEVNPNAPAAGPPAALGLSDALKVPWGQWVNRVVLLALIPFFFLQAPQIIANFHSLASDPAKVSILPWIGYSTGILANSNLWGYHIEGKRHAVAFVQAAGVLTSTIVLAQIYMAGTMPFAALIAMGGLIAVSVSINALKWTGRLPDKMWAAWKNLSVLLGLFALPMGFSVTFDLMKTHPAAVLAASSALSALGAGAMFFDRKGKLPAAVKSLWSTLGAWLGTMLFVFLPIPQIVNNFTHPENVAGLAVGTLLLSTAGNLMEVTGALWAKSQIWFVGSIWAVLVGGWGVLLSLLLLGAASPAFFGAFSAVVFAYLWGVIYLTKKNHPDSSYRETLKFILRGDGVSKS